MKYAIGRLEEMLHEGMNLSKQASYRRRAPDPGAIPSLSRVRAALAEFLKSNPNSERAWRLLMLAEEAFLDYEAARHCLEQAIRLSGRRDRKDLKKPAT